MANFLQLTPENIAQAKNMSWRQAISQDFNPRIPNYRGFSTAYQGADKTGLGKYVTGGLKSIAGMFEPGSNVGGATPLTRKLALGIMENAPKLLSKAALPLELLRATPANADEVEWEKQLMASRPTQDDMIKAGIRKQMINEGTATPMGRRYGNMSMGYGRPNYVADRSPVSQALKATEIPEFKVAGVPNYSEFDDFESYLQGDKQGIFSQIKNAANKYGAPIKQGIGTLMSMASGIPGLGLLINSFTPNPSDSMSKSFAVGNPNAVFGQDYAGGRLPGQDAFGINTVSMFGNYPGYYDQYVQDYEAGKYSSKSKFAFDKYLHAKNVVNKNLDRIQKDYGSTNKTFNWQDHEQDKGGDVSSGNNYTGGAAQGTGSGGSPMQQAATRSKDLGSMRGAIGRSQGGLASLWRR